MSRTSTTGTAELCCSAERALRTNGRPRLSWPRYCADSTRILSSVRSTLFLSSRKLNSCFSSSGAKARKASSTPIAAGSTSFITWMTLSWLRPGAAQPRRATRSRSASSDMGENVLLCPAGEIEDRPVRQEVEAGLGQSHAALALEPFVELFPERVKIANVGGGIILLGVAELGRAPVGLLLLLGDFGAEQLRIGRAAW